MGEMPVHTDKYVVECDFWDRRTDLIAIGLGLASPGDSLDLYCPWH